MFIENVSFNYLFIFDTLQLTDKAKERKRKKTSNNFDLIHNFVIVILLRPSRFLISAVTVWLHIVCILLSIYIHWILMELLMNLLMDLAIPCLSFPTAATSDVCVAYDKYERILLA